MRYPAYPAIVWLDVFEEWDGQWRVAARELALSCGAAAQAARRGLAAMEARQFGRRHVPPSV
jgi:hypothetical protein